ncbi:hypothetical protein DPMN_081468 [Dreissena polymorpha]|uniref:Uncharacterized protein n=1 Tax=Dreissena polymorpha TaxID=45954 RepID=A0A9D4BGJ1_DREPO|nr:hypothetical protein DPMN_081468 [Dreissena polymorpha]
MSCTEGQQMTGEGICLYVLHRGTADDGGGYMSCTEGQQMTGEGICPAQRDSR